MTPRIHDAAGRARVVVALIALAMLMVVTGSTTASSQTTVTLHQARVLCQPGVNHPYVMSHMDRIYPQGWEVWDRQAWFRDKFSGAWFAGGPIQRSGMIRPGASAIDLLTEYPGKLTVNSLPPSSYYVGMYYRWWYADPGTPWKTTGWKWVFSPPRLASGALTGLYLRQGELAAYPTDVCLTAPVTINIPLEESASTDRMFTRTGSLKQFRLVPRSLEAVTGTTKQSRQPTTTHATKQATNSTCFGRRPSIVGTGGSDTITGTRGPDIIVGLGGDDTIRGRGGADTICGGEGVDVLLGQAGHDRIAGQSGGDLIVGHAGNDFVRAGSGIDVVGGGGGSDVLLGGGDSLDIVAYVLSRTGVTVNFESGSAEGEGGGVDNFSGFNGVAGSFFDDVLIGASGQQGFLPLSGDDQVSGGDGTDYVLYFAAAEGVNVNLVTGTAVGEGNDSLSSIEFLEGSPHDDTIIGDAGYNWLVGLGGDDTLDGTAGGDTLEGLEGIDTCTNAALYVGCEIQGSTSDVPAPEEPSSEAPPSPPPS